MAQVSSGPVGTQQLRTSFHRLRLVAVARAGQHAPSSACNAISFPFKSPRVSSPKDPLPRVTVSPKEDDLDLLAFLRNRISSATSTTGWGQFVSGKFLPSDSSAQAPRLLFLGLFLASLTAATVADVHKAGNSIGTVTLSSFQLQPADISEDAAGSVTVSLKATAMQMDPADAAMAAAGADVSQQYDTVQLTGVVAALLVAATALNGEYARKFAQQAPEIAAAEMPSELVAIGVSPEATSALLRAATPHAGKRAPGSAYLARTLAIEAVRVLAVGQHRATAAELRAVRLLCQRVHIRDLSGIAAGSANEST